MKNKYPGNFLLILLCVFIFFVNIDFVFAGYQRVEKGQSIRIGEFVFDDNYIPTTTPCTITIYDSIGTLKVNNATMTSELNGWHYYDYSVGTNEIEGNWPAVMTCGSALNGDLIKGDKTFVVGPNFISSSTIAEAVSNEINPDLNSLFQSATSSILSSVLNIPDDVWNFSTRTISSFGSLVSDITTAVWASGTRTLTGFGTLVADVWTSGTRTLTGAGLNSGSLATLSDVNNARDNINTNIQTASSSIVASLNSNITAIKTKTDTIDWVDIDGIVTDTGAIKTKTDTINWSDVSAVKTKTDTIAWTDVSAIKTKTDTIIWGDISDIKTDVANIVGEIGTGNITAIKTNTDTIDWSDIDGIVTSNGQIKAKTDTIAWADISAIKTNTDTIDWSDISAIQTKTDTIVWGDITSLQTNLATAETNINANVDAEALAINNNILSASTTLSASIASVASSILSLPVDVATAVWASGTRTLTGFGTLVADVWTSGTRTLTGAGLNSGSLATQDDINNIGTITSTSTTGWTLSMSDFSTINAGDNYLTTVTTVYNGNLTDSQNTPTITIYDPSRNVVVSNVTLTRISEGTYTYSYTTSPTSEEGVWESRVNAVVESGKNLLTTDFWNVNTSPPQVLITSMNSTVIPSIKANVRITNEGSIPYEYQYEWCVTNSPNNQCGGGDDIYYASAAKLINPGNDFDTVLDATVPSAGNYYFKVVVHYGTEKSGSSRFFSATNASTGGSSSGGGGGGGSSTSKPTTTNSNQCVGADLNGDKRVNTIDFSILLSFWKKTAPFTNKCVDINQDKNVNITDFSIMLSQWGTSGKKIK